MFAVSDETVSDISSNQGTPELDSVARSANTATIFGTVVRPPKNLVTFFKHLSLPSHPKTGTIAVKLSSLLTCNFATLQLCNQIRIDVP
jgi:hypothetical protein